MKTKSTRKTRPTKGKGEYPPPVVLRLPRELTARIDALAPAVAADATTAALMGRLSRGALYRLVVIEGLKVLEQRYQR